MTQQKIKINKKKNSLNLINAIIVCCCCCTMVADFFQLQLGLT
jgi:hypothetical protein